MAENQTDGEGIPSEQSFLNEAQDRGADAGEAAASGVLDFGRMPGGRTAEIAYARKLTQMLEDGDPRLDEYIQEPAWLSGEWAGESIGELLGDLIEDAGSFEYDIEDEIMEAYEEAASDTFWESVQEELQGYGLDEDDGDGDL